MKSTLWWPWSVHWVSIIGPVQCTLGAHHGGCWMYIGCSPWRLLGAHHGGLWGHMQSPSWWPRSVRWMPITVPVGHTLGAHRDSHWVHGRSPLWRLLDVRRVPVGCPPWVRWETLGIPPSAIRCPLDAHHGAH